MNLEDLQVLLDSVPESIPHSPTFMEIAGYPHYENVCSNILKFYFNPGGIHGLKDLVLKSFLESIEYSDLQLTSETGIEIKREVTTTNGRIDILIISRHWVIAIENKIFHILNNDLEEYSDHLEKRYKGRKIIKVVLSIRKEEKLSGGFENLTYKDFIKQIDKNITSGEINKTSEFYLYLNQFITTIKNLYKPIHMEKHEIDFLINNQDKIANLNALDQKLNMYINQRAHKIENSLNNRYPQIKSWVYAGNDIGFTLKTVDAEYKLECPIARDSIRICICVESNYVDIDKLKKLDYFIKNDIHQFRILDDNSRLVIEEGIDFFIDDNDLINKLKAILDLYKISE